MSSPVFNKVVIQLDPRYSNGKAFTISTNGNSDENIYIQSMVLNGKPHRRYWIEHQEILDGGTLEIEMGPMPRMSIEKPYSQTVPG